MVDENPLQPGRTNSYLLKLISQSLDELHHHIRIGGKDSFPKLKILTIQAELHGEAYSEPFKVYMDKKKELDKTSHSYMDIEEHLERLQIVLNLLNQIGLFTLRERNPYPQQREADDYFFYFLDFDTSGVSPDIPLVEKLEGFYYDELRKEFEDKPDKLRRKEAINRAKRAYVWYERYLEYEKGGFNPSDIERLFGITNRERRILDLWLDDLVYYGRATSVFAKAGSGKSNFSTFVIQIILIIKPQWDIVTNVPLIFSPLMAGPRDYPEYQIKRCHFIMKSGELLMESAKIGLDERIPVVLLDEFDSALLSTQMQSKAGTNLKDYMFVERHYDIQGPLLIYHTRKDIPVPMRNKDISHQNFIITSYVNHLKRSMKHVISSPDYWNGKRAGGFRYLPIPLSSMPYHNQGTSPFNILDVDMQWLYNHLSGSKKDALKDILRLVPLRPWEPKKKKGKNDEDKEN